MPENLSAIVAAVKEAAAATAAWGKAMVAVARTEEAHKQALSEVAAWEEAKEIYMAARNMEGDTPSHRGSSPFTLHRELTTALHLKREAEQAAIVAQAKAEAALKHMSEVEQAM